MAALPDETEYLLAPAVFRENYKDEHHPIPPVSVANMLRDLIETDSIFDQRYFETWRLARGLTRSEALPLSYGARGEYCVALEVSRNKSGLRPRCRMG